jgi:hypothetical protein
MNHDIRRGPDEDRLDRAVGALRGAAVPDGPPEELVADTLAALRRAGGGRPGSQTFFSRMKTMKSLSRIAAGVLLAVGLAVLGAVLLPTPTVAFADVVGRVSGARSLMYKVRSTAAHSEETFDLKYFVLADGRYRAEGPGAMVNVVDPRAGKTILLDTEAKTAAVGVFKGPGGAGNRDPLEQFRKRRDKDAKDLGEREVGGRKVRGFVTSADGPEYTVWADVETGVPVTVEATLLLPDGAVKFVMSDFVVDPNLDDSLFSVEVPEGYAVANQPGVHLATVAAPPGELVEHVVAALRGYARLSGGALPPKLDDWDAYSARFGSPLKDEDFKLMGHVGALTPSLLSLPKDGWAYLGEGKTLGDKQAVVFWYRKKDGTYRAVYGDMRVEDVKGGALPGK